MRSKMLVGADEIANYLNGYRKNRKWIGIKTVKRLIKSGSLPAKQLEQLPNRPYTITEDALLRWHDEYGKEQNA